MQKKLFLFCVLGAFIYILSPVLIPVILGGVFSVLLIPFVEKLERRKIPNVLSASLVTFAVTLGLILPVGFLGVTGARIAFSEFKLLQLTPSSVPLGTNQTDTQLGDGIQRFVEERFGEVRLRDRLEKVSKYLPVKPDEIIDQAQDLGKALVGRVALSLGKFVGALPSIALELVILILSIFFFLLDGRSFVVFLKRHSFLLPDATESVFSAFGQMCKSVILASLASGASQAFLFATVMWILDLNHAFLWGVAVFIGSFIPLVGSAPLTLGLAVYYLLLAAGAQGWVLLITAFIVSSVDNVVRALVLRGAANLHPLLAFLSALGGLKTLGFSGVFLGPILAGLSVVLIEEIRPKR